MGRGDYQVVILCGGRGTRLREETEFKPKPLVEIGGYPILFHIMKHYAHFGYQSFVLCLGYKGWMIKEYFLNYEYMNSDFTITLSKERQIEVHGAGRVADWQVTLADTGLQTMTGGRIKRIEKYLTGDTFFATYGDGLSDLDLHELVKFHKQKGRIATVTGVHPISRFGEIEANDQGIAHYFGEKPRLDDFVSGGFFVFDRRIFDYLDENSVLEEEPMRQLTKEGQLAVYPYEGFWTSMDTYRDYLELNKIWEKGRPQWKLW